MPQILLIRLSALGDVLTASPVPTVIRRHAPDARITWVVEQRCADALAGHPGVDELIVVPSSREWGRWLTQGQWSPLRAALAAVSARLRREQYDLAIDLQGLLKSAALLALTRATQKCRPADSYEQFPGWRPRLLPRRLDPTHIATMYTSLLEPLGFPLTDRADLRLVFNVPPAAQQRVADWLRPRGLRPGEFVALIPGTTRPQKMWPEASWSALADRLQQRSGLPAVLVGGPGERELAARVCGAAQHPPHDAAGALRLPETAALLQAARCCVAVDTGPMHLAVAVGCPTVAIAGSTEHRLFQDGSPHVLLHRDFPCSPCFRRPICDGRHECLAAITPADVERTLATLFRGAWADRAVRPAASDV
ncbi:MAG: glycosyltransferase family 9 protein [Fimbriimonadaceae bacterium]|nr:glycosyltransferase family 9 protein [Fimbriimonadaceae bacterium]